MGFREGAEGVGGVGAYVVEGFGFQGAVGAGRGCFVVGEGVYAGEVAFFHAGDVCFFRAAGVDDGVAQEAAGSVYGGPAVSGAGDADAGEACPFQGGEEGGAAGDAIFAVVGEEAVPDVVAVAGFPLADFRDVPVQGEAVGGDVVQDVEFAVRAGLDDPDGHKVRYADVPGGVDGQEGVCLEFRGEAGQLPEVVDLIAEDGACGDGVEGFFRNSGVFLPHEVALSASHGLVPGFLLIVQGDAVFFFQRGEVFERFRVVGGLAAFQPVFVLVYPGEEEEFEVQRGEGLADHVHGSNRQGVVEAVLASLVGGFFDDDAGLGDGVEAAGHDFLRLFGVMGGDDSQLRDVEDLKGAAAQGGGGVDGGAVGEFYVGLGEGGAVHLVLDHFSDGGKEAVFFRGVIREVVEVVKGEVHFVHFFLGFRSSAVDDAAGDVGGEEGGVEFQYGGEGGDAELAHFQDVIAVVEVVMEVFLRPVHVKALNSGVLVQNPVQVVDPPFAVGKEGGYFLVLFRGEFHGVER